MRIYIILIFLFFSCSTMSKKNEIHNRVCNENLKFKSEFFRNIEIVTYYMTESTSISSFKEYEQLITNEKIKNYQLSLKFISYYTHVSFESMANYARTYPIGVFEMNKKGWLKWYDDNKCNDIQLKN